MANANFPMSRRRFGKTGLTMPVFSCGGMRYQDGWTDKPMREIDPATQVNLEATLNRAFELGINHVETARGYGPSERQLGQFLPRQPRDQLIIQTKIGCEEDPEVFYANAIDSLERLQLEHVDLLGIHGINNQKKLDWVTRDGGCFAMAQRLKKEGRCRHVGFSTHGSVRVINQAIEYVDGAGEGFEYINLHWYYIYQETASCVENATRRDMGVFIISPSDKGGMLYKAPPRLMELCQPLHPMTFNDLFCLRRPEIHTLSVGAARPSDFNEHMDALAYLDRAEDIVRPVVERLQARYAEVVELELRDPWALGLPPISEIPGEINIGRIVQLRNLAKAYDMVEYGQMRYNLLGNAEDWFPGHTASPDRLREHRPALEALFKRLPAGSSLMGILEETHQLLFKEPQKRLSESD
ncbi:MAG: aldo/keto reductase [Opitutales bacterium]|jgi:predicted aldo/keto reductase-like oxidoreductase